MGVAMGVAHIHIEREREREQEVATKYLNVDILNFEKRRRRKFGFHYF